MTKEEALKRLDDAGGIFGHMYGSKKEKIIYIKKDELEIYDDRFIEVWGWPGPDYTSYYYKDYGETWAFQKEELEPITLYELYDFLPEKLRQTVLRLWGATNKETNIIPLNAAELDEIISPFNINDILQIRINDKPLFMLMIHCNFSVMIVNPHIIFTGKDMSEVPFNTLFDLDWRDKE